MEDFSLKDSAAFQKMFQETCVLQLRIREGEMFAIMPLEPPVQQGGAYLGHILEKRIIKIGALKISDK